MDGAIVLFWGRVVVATLLGLIGGFAILGNWVIAVRAWWDPASSSSLLPGCGGVLAAFAVLAIPVEGAWRWVWIPCALDLFWLAMLAWPVLVLVRRTPKAGTRGN